MKTSERAASGNLAAVMPRLPHHMEMINRTINGGYPLKLGVPIVEALEHDLTRFQQAITKWISADTQPALYEALNSLRAPLVTLREYFRVPGESGMGREDVQTLVDFIYDRIRELRTIAAEVNAVYSWQSGFDYMLNPIVAEKHISI